MQTGKVKMMDSGLSRISWIEGLGDAVSAVSGILGREGGKVTLEGDRTLTAEWSDPWVLKFITAEISAEKGSDKTFAVSFREGNAPTRLSFFLILLIVLLTSSGLAVLLRPLWSVPLVIALILLALYIYYSPEKSCQKRMERIIRETDKL